jgi:hypothetical protein
MMQRVVIAVLTAAAGFAQDVARMEQVIQAEVSGKKFMGSVLVARGNEVLLSKGYGSANLEWDIPNSPSHQVPFGIYHQAVHRSLDPLAGRARQAEGGRPGEEVFARRSRRLFEHPA